jgi:hypothetical protein
MKVRKRILELGVDSYFKNNTSHHVDFYQIGKKSFTEENLTLSRFLELRRKLLLGQYDLVCASFYGICETPWNANRAFFSNLGRLSRCFLGRFYSFGPWVIDWLLRGTSIPLVVVDRKDDPALIPPQFFPLLKRCRIYYWREMPLKLENGFMYTTMRMMDTSAIHHAPVFLENRDKIRPISIGLDYNDDAKNVDPNVPKEIDIYFSGSRKGELARTDGLRQLEELREEGYNVVIGGKEFIPRREFLQTCARSWLVFSPEGHGWDCFRHYEAAVSGSVPLINYPRTLRYHPLIDHEHALYYGVEDNDLKRVVRAALTDKNKLREMGAAARRFVLEHHTHEKLQEHILQSLEDGAPVGI